MPYTGGTTCSVQFLHHAHFRHNTQQNPFLVLFRIVLNSAMVCGSGWLSVSETGSASSATKTPTTPMVASSANGWRVCTKDEKQAKQETDLWARIEKKFRMNSYLIIHFPTSEEVSEVSERMNE